MNEYTKELLIITFYCLALLAMILMYVCYSGYVYTMKYENDILKIARLEDIEDGDILLVSYKDVKRIIVQGFGFLKYFHPSLVCTKDGTRCVMELANYNDDAKDYHIMPLSQWLKINKKHSILLNKLQNDNLDVNRKEINTFILDYYTKHSSLNLKGDILGFLNPYLEYEEVQHNKEYLCYEIVADIYIKLGILKKQSTTYYTPEKFESLNLINGYYQKSSILDLSELKGYYID